VDQQLRLDLVAEAHCLPDMADPLRHLRSVSVPAATSDSDEQHCHVEVRASSAATSLLQMDCFLHQLMFEDRFGEA
jgi:hypothetical protein